MMDKHGIAFVEIPAVTFRMGTDSLDVASPTHDVKLDSYWVSKYEITNKQFEAISRHGRPAASTGDQCPVTNVTLQQVRNFIDILNRDKEFTYSLPTEAQWEYAARGGLMGKNYPWGDELPSSAKANI